LIRTHFPVSDYVWMRRAVMVVRGASAAMGILLILQIVRCL